MMKDEHLKDEEIEDLLRGNEEVRNRLILHHLAVCPECYGVAGYILDLYLDGTVDIELGSVDVSLGRSRREAPALWEELRHHTFKRQKALVKKSPRFVSWGLAELLCGLAEAETPRDPERARELGELAVEIASRIDEWEVAEPDWQHEIHAYALAHRANAQRVLGDLPGAAATFAAADALWQPAANENVGNVLGYEARYLALKASLRRAERKLPEALKLLSQALAASPPPDLRARILINQAKVYEEQGRIEEAIEVLQKAREEADEGDARLRLCLAQNHLDYLPK
jgi:tetratricopeptide (TPR) repeat protein